MIGKDTIESAIKWCEIGGRWIENGAIRLGLNYLDRAIAVFSEGRNLPWLTYARHQRLDGLKQAEREDEAVQMFDEVMEGYNRMGDSYGQSLLLAHLAECHQQQNRGERAMVTLNLASAIAEAEGHNHVQAFIWSQHARLAQERGNLLMAVRLFRKAEALMEELGEENDSLHLRYYASEALIKLGERADAIALLEDLQNRLLRNMDFQHALKALNLLSKLYEESGSWDEKNRIAQLTQMCGQNIIRGEGQRNNPKEGLPLIRPFLEFVPPGSGEVEKQENA